MVSLVDLELTGGSSSIRSVQGISGGAGSGQSQTVRTSDRWPDEMDTVVMCTGEEEAGGGGGDDGDDDQISEGRDEQANSVELDDSALDTSIRLKKKQQQQTHHQKPLQMNIITSTSANTSASTDDVAMTQQQETSTRTSNNNNNYDQELAMEDEMDEERLKRILACKRLSEGCNRFSAANYICRKNSLHLIGEGLPPVTEGEPMRHMSHHMSQNIESTSSSSVSSGSLRSAGSRHMSVGVGGGHMSKRNSQDDNTASCSSSTSLDGPRSPSRRRSSTVSQCSSVLSEGTRQQLNFDLSPDLAPDSSILEANAISPTDLDRPASPEPSSLASGDGDGSFDMMRPMSRMSSQYCDDIMLTASPDSTLGDSNDNSNPDSLSLSLGLGLGLAAGRQQRINQLDGHGNQQQPELATDPHKSANSETTTASAVSTTNAVEREQHDATIRDNLERIISHVSAVKVSSMAKCANLEEQNSNSNSNHNCNSEQALSLGQKRAHTPFGANLQRNKTSLISSSPSPTT